MEKPFDRNLYLENDHRAKQAAANLMIDQGFTLETPLQNQVEQYKKWDFVIRRNSDGQQVTVETEVKKVWDRSGVWQGFQTIDIPGRKRHSQANVFIMINKHFDTAAVTTMHLIHQSPVTVKDTIYTQNERFFNCPLEIFRFYVLKEGSWIRMQH